MRCGDTHSQSSNNCQHPCMPACQHPGTHFSSLERKMCPWVLANIGHGCWQLPTAAAGKTRMLASSRDMPAPRTHLDSADVGQFARVLARGCWQQTAFGLRMPARMALRQPGTLWSCVLACWHARLLAIVRRLAVRLQSDRYSSGTVEPCTTVGYK